jgi:uncharacterized protein (DUF58 family)
MKAADTGSAPAPATAGVYASLDDLVRLEQRARGWSLRHRQPVQSVLMGRHGSRLRGRGLDFEEVRGYLPGDDIRSIDWRVTAHTGKPQTRVYTEERDRPALLVVDQRQSMFFGTRLNMKSVTAAEAAALAAWRAFGTGDRVGAVVFDDVGFDAIRPHRSRSQVLRILDAVAARNRALRADAEGAPAPDVLNEALEQARHLIGHDHVVCIISDFDGADARTRSLVAGLAQHNDVIAILVHDPSSRELPESGRLVVSGGELQIRVNVGDAGERKAVLAAASARTKPILAWTRDLGVPVLPLSTGEDVAEQLRLLLGAAARPRRA